MDKTLRSALVTVETPEEAVARLDRLHSDATTALRHALEHFLETREPPSPDERARFRYPEIRVSYEPEGLQPLVRRAFAKFPAPGVYATTITQPAAFRSYLLEQLRPLMNEYGATVEVGVSSEEIPYPYVFERGDELSREGVTAAELALFFPAPLLSAVGDEIADGSFQQAPGMARPLALFDAVRVDFSLRRLMHYTGG
ncbi:MAG: AMP nucleosidase, partial [Hyphomicrobiales bacterium]|nr:AMP nucleosidase [Hyphomicrobiales bacterium]